MSGSILICNLVVDTFFELGMPPPIDVCETLLVKDGSFVGHKFQCDGGYAIWGVGWNSVEFYDDDGKLLKMVAVKDALRSSA
jgi:hypothetical protein